MTAFDDIIAEGVDELITESGVTIVYRPLNGVPRTIYAIIEREPVSRIPEAERARAPRIIVTVKNDLCDGIGSSEIDTGGDKIEVSKRIGEDPDTLDIMKLISHDQSRVVFEVR